MPWPEDLPVWVHGRVGVWVHGHIGQYEEHATELCVSSMAGTAVMGARATNSDTEQAMLKVSHSIPHVGVCLNPEQVSHYALRIVTVPYNSLS